MTRHDVLARLREMYARFNALMDRVPDADMERALVRGRWTVKDVLAHLTSWEVLEVGWMQSLRRGETPLPYRKRVIR